MKKKLIAATTASAIAIAMGVTAYANRGNGDLGVVYVSSQGLYYDTFVPVQVLPNRGPFQLLKDGVTAYGPGDPGYRGGRWWVDDGDGIREDEDRFLLCPLLPPGRLAP